MRKLLTVLLVLFAAPVFGQSNWASTQAQFEFKNALTAATRFGVPRYTTVALPTCDSTNTGAVAFNTTSGFLTFCNGTSWGDANSGAASAVTPGSTTVGTSTNCLMFADGSSVLQCDNTLAKLDNSGAGNGAFTFRKTSQAAATDNGGFINFQGTLTTPTSGSVIDGMAWWVAGAGSGNVIQRAADYRLQAGYTGSATTQGLRALNQSAGTGTAYLNFDASSASANYGMTARFSATTTGAGVGLLANAAGGDIGIGGVFTATDNKANGVRVGVVGLASQTTATPTTVGGYFGIRTTAPTFISSALQLDNAAIAVPLIVAQDNGASLPTTGATATWQVADGAYPQIGNGVLTSATMTAETQARDSGSMIHSYTWTNAQVVALGATTAGDISVATLPAKTVVKNAYVVITGTAAGVTTLTVACGRTSATYIDYIVASDAKAAANTVYGDASAERGTNLTGYDLPSYTGTTAVNCHFISTGANLSAVTGSTGRVILETSLVP